jgi:hypothetical protein
MGDTMVGLSDFSWDLVIFLAVSGIIFQVLGSYSDLGEIVT